MHKLKEKTQAGYSLIQIAIGMVVLGIFIAAAGNSFILYKKNKDLTTTQSNIENVREAIQAYRQNFGSYPCPARMDVDRGDPEYGVPTDCGPTGIYTAQPAGNCQNGICIETAIDGTAYIMTNGLNVTPPARVLTNPRVRVGAIPFRLLQIDERITIDGYSSKLLYAVTESMADPDSFREGNGAIHMVNAVGDSLIDPPGSSPFVIVSPGPNMLGAYSHDGAQVSPCSGTVLDAENCRNFDPLSLVTPPTLPVTPPFALYVSDYRSDAAVNNSLDDTVEYFAKAEIPKWKRTETNIEDIEALVDTGVGINTPNIPVDAIEIPLSTVSFDHDNAPGTPGITQRGALRATGNVRADQICDLTGTECFNADLLASPNVATDGISCANPGEYMIGIADGQALCADVRLYCANNATPILKGVFPSGAPDCIAKPLNPCSAAVQLCSGSPLVANRRNSNQAGITRPINVSGSHGQTIMVTDAGSYAVNPRRSNFTCNNGVWLHGGSAQFGLCSCTTPAMTTQTVNVACPGQSPSGNVATQNQTWNAATCSWNNTGGVDFSACLCPGPATAAPATTTTSCGAGYNSGNFSTSYTFNNAVNVCNWQGSTTNNCTCDPAVAGTTNGGTQTLTTPVACNTVPGFATFTGNAFRIQTFNGTPGTCGWQNTGWDTSGCSCNTTTEYPAAAPPSPCTSCQTETTAAVWVYKNVVSGGSCVPGPAYEKTPAVCTNIAYRWRATSASPLGPPGSSAGTRPEVNSSCTCAEKATTRSCYNQTGPSDYYYYNCTCNN